MLLSLDPGCLADSLLHSVLETPQSVLLLLLQPLYLLLLYLSSKLYKGQRDLVYLVYRNNEVPLLYFHMYVSYITTLHFVNIHIRQNLSMLIAGSNSSFNVGSSLTSELKNSAFFIIFLKSNEGWVGLCRKAAVVTS